MSTIGFIGGGNMAEALLKGILEAGLYAPRDIWMSDVRPERLDQLKQQYHVHITVDNRELTSHADILILSVKPQQMSPVLEEIAGAVRKGTVVISIAAGIRTSRIQAALPGAQVIRVMPNTPAMVGAGASGLYSAGASEEAMKKAVEIFSSVGRAIAVDDEDLIDAVTAVSGSGPAYFFLLIEQMIEAGVQLGLDPESSKTLVLQTAKGAALLAEQADQKSESPADLRKKVTSPGGTTEAALKVFSAEGFESMVKKALKAAFDRGQELSRDKR
jgi:pyrroline-5-carboxylate reductase